MPTATNNIDNKNNGYSKIVAHVTRQYPNDSNNKHIEKELTKYNQTFFITNFDKQLSKNVPNDYIKEHDKKAIARRHKKDVWGSKKNFLAEQKAKGNIEDKRLTATVGNHEYYDEIISRVEKLHPEMNHDEVMESVVNTYNRAFKSFAKGFNQTHENLVISRCDTNVDERPPHMHYQLTGMTVTAKGKPSFKFGAALHKTYSENEKTNVGNDYKAFRADADEMLVQHFKKAMVSEYGNEFKDIKLERTGAPGGLSQRQREYLNNEVEKATALKQLELRKKEEKLDHRDELLAKREEANNKLRYEKSKLRKAKFGLIYDNSTLEKNRDSLTSEIEDADEEYSNIAMDMFDAVQGFKNTGFEYNRPASEDVLSDEEYEPLHYLTYKGQHSQDSDEYKEDEAEATQDVEEFNNHIAEPDALHRVGMWARSKMDEYTQKMKDKYNHAKAQAKAKYDGVKESISNAYYDTVTTLQPTLDTDEMKPKAKTMINNELEGKIEPGGLMRHASVAFLQNRAKFTKDMEKAYKRTREKQDDAKESYEQKQQQRNNFGPEA